MRKSWDLSTNYYVMLVIIIQKVCWIHYFPYCSWILPFAVILCILSIAVMSFDKVLYYISSISDRFRSMKFCALINILPKRMADWLSFHCVVRKSFNFFWSKSEWRVIIHLQIICDETIACKIPIIEYSNLFVDNM